MYSPAVWGIRPQLFLVIEFQNVVIALSRFIEWRVDGFAANAPSGLYSLGGYWLCRCTGSVSTGCTGPAYRILLNGDPIQPYCTTKRAFTGSLF